MLLISAAQVVKVGYLMQGKILIAGQIIIIQQEIAIV